VAVANRILAAFGLASELTASVGPLCVNLWGDRLRTTIF